MIQLGEAGWTDVEAKPLVGVTDVYRSNVENRKSLWFVSLELEDRPRPLVLTILDSAGRKLRNQINQIKQYWIGNR